MDSFAGLLSGPRVHGAFLLRALFDPPWGLYVQDEAPLTIVVMLEGQAWATPDDGSARQLETGDVAMIRGPGHYRMGDTPDTPPQIVIHPDQRASTIDGTEIGQTLNRGVRTWGNSADGATKMLVGTYNLESEVSMRLLRAMPTLLVLGRNEWDSPFVDLLADEIVKEMPGQEAILDRLLDLLLMSTIRAWFAQPDSDAPGWYLAESDQVIGKTIRMLHNNPAHPWTVAELAREAGMSRASLARRFTDVVGEPPLTFLTNWRLTLAADLLCEPGATIGSVAQQVGYSSPYALSAAFKRVRGVSPKEHRMSRTT